MYRLRSQACKKVHRSAFLFSFHSAQLLGESNQLRYLKRAAADIPVSNQADQTEEVVRVSLVVY